NVLTPVADVWMGIAVTTGTLEPAERTIAITLSSVCLYLSGMVLNDVFGFEEDKHARPERPLPSGRIKRAHAAILGAVLMATGLGAAAWGAARSASITPLMIAVVLAIGIVGYDKLSKDNAFKPWLMGLCRGLNVVLGMSVARVLTPMEGVPVLSLGETNIAQAMALYVAGVTFFARSEDRTSPRRTLVIGLLVALLGLLHLAAGPLQSLLRVDWIEETYAQIGIPLDLSYLKEVSPTLRVSMLAWATLWGVVTLFVCRRFVAALIHPDARRVQAAVGHGIQCIIIINAALAWGYAGHFWGLAILALWPPTMLAARFIPQT
ncbi:MAG: UbiA family prenyltransferase, partial [Caldilineaceae bacterium]|nr:UbiA family prenyltransferase [Caldilineaceae bacterium]